MDSKERDERIKKGFGERGEKLYNPKKKKGSPQNNTSSKKKKNVKKIIKQDKH